MPPQLVAFHFEDWHDPVWDVDYEPGGHFQHYLARTEWQEARRRWVNGEEWPPALESPRPVAGGSVYTSPVGEEPRQGATPHLNRAAVEHRARPIKLH
ncbi:hypothetical protein HZZ00_34985 [Streptomyces sp. NEAU-sy36]|uniref:hypothetical protein n=1 Tax=unclassified Streptomyces TaxID=2593676 RepID=UPI0015D5F8C8|nr:MULTISPECIES: hypothetical protein [unclassified Streptomyces]QLJ05717.1 hypothetical protein HZZ00_34985 [Streptomyces sp. NEAU-sy36]